MEKIDIIAHRGAFLPEGPIPEVMNHYSIPENTIEAFKRAILNNWGIETDIRLAKDGSFIVIHDDNIQRFSGQSGMIEQMSLDEIKKVTYKSDPQFTIPELAELCQLAKGAFIAFQIKRGHNQNSGLFVGRAVATAMSQYGLENSILFDATIEEAKILHQEFPWLNLSLSVGEENYSPTIYTPSQALSDEFTSVFTSVWADEWKIKGSIYNTELLKKLRAAYSGRIDVISPELHYNEDHPLSKDINKLKEFWQELVSWNLINGICTDYPTTVSEIVKS